MDKTDAEFLRDLEAVTAEHFLTEDDLVEFLNAEEEAEPSEDG